MRWLFSTFLAAIVGGGALAAATLSSLDGLNIDNRPIGVFTRPGPDPTSAGLEPRGGDGLNWALPKADRLNVVTGAASTRFIIHEPVRQVRKGSEYLHNKPYARVVARLAVAQPTPTTEIVPFDPVRLYAGEDAAGDVLGPSASDPKSVTVEVVELLGGFLPLEDGQELDHGEVSEFVSRLEAGERAATTLRPALVPESKGDTRSKTLRSPGASLPIPVEMAEPATTVIAKVTGEVDELAEDADGNTQRTFKALRGETLSRVLIRAGIESGLARQVVEAARTVLKDDELLGGDELQIAAMPLPASPHRLSPTRLLVYSSAGDHRLSVIKTQTGEFIASADPLGRVDTGSPRAEVRVDPSATLYTALFHALLAQSVPMDSIERLIRVHAYDVDYRRRPRSNDAIELFFDVRDERGPRHVLGDLLATQVTVDNATHRYWRFQSQDGTVDFYDENGQNSRKFLIKVPIKLADPRITSGFGMRLHPTLNVRRMHTGVDWAAPAGTPIVAAGSGVIEELGWKGHFSYGHYIRIRHANGYQSAYGHLSRYAPGLREGMRVTQGQLIGFVGSTGQSTAPHLHYEVIVSDRFVDPMSIKSPQARILAGADLTAFRKERRRIEELWRRPAVRIEHLDSR